MAESKPDAQNFLYRFLASTPKPFLRVAIVLLALAPSAWLAWNARHMPHLGIYHDDSVYFVTAKSWAEGRGHRIEHLPGEPYQTKYPPVLPLLLSLAWRINPNFPDNLSIVTLITWVALPLFVVAAALYFRDLGFGGWKTALLCCCLALNPFLVSLSTLAMTELWFGAELALAIVLIERLHRAGSRWWEPLAAGAVVALMLLTRSAGLLLLLTAPALLIWRRRFRAAVLFLAVAGPAALGWNLWQTLHYPPGSDLTTLYYTNYGAYRFAIFGWSDLPLLVKRNLEGLFTGVGQLFIFRAYSPKALIVARLTGLAAILGVVWLARRTGKFHWPAYAAVYGAALLGWHYPPDARFLMPLAPLLLAVLVEEGLWFLGRLQAAWNVRRTGVRLAVAGIVAAALVVGAWAVRQTWDGLASYLPARFQKWERQLAEIKPVYRWIRGNTPPGSTFVANDDALLYLYTGRHAIRLVVPPDLVYYRPDEEAVVRLIQSVPDYALRLGIDYALFTPSGDFRLAPADVVRRAVSLLAQDGERLRSVYSERGFQVFKVVAQGADRDEP